MMKNGTENMAQEQKWTRRRMATVGLAGMAAVFVSGCLGGGGGDSDNEIDLVAAYDRVLACMTHDELVKAVGGKPNDTDLSGTMRWEYGGYRLQVFLQFDHADSKRLMTANGTTVKYIGFAENCY